MKIKHVWNHHLVLKNYSTTTLIFQQKNTHLNDFDLTMGFFKLADHTGIARGNWDLICSKGKGIWHSHETHIPSSKLTWLAGKSGILVGDISSNGYFCIPMNPTNWIIYLHSPETNSQLFAPENRPVLEPHFVVSPLPSSNLLDFQGLTTGQ